MKGGFPTRIRPVEEEIEKGVVEGCHAERCGDLFGERFRSRAGWEEWGGTEQMGVSRDCGWGRDRSEEVEDGVIVAVLGVGLGSKDLING